MPAVKANYEISITDLGTIRGYGWKTPLDSFTTTAGKTLICKNKIILDYEIPNNFDLNIPCTGSTTILLTF